MAPVEKSSPKWTFMRALSLDEDDEAHQDLYNAMKVSVQIHTRRNQSIRYNSSRMLCLERDSSRIR